MYLVFKLNAPVITFCHELTLLHILYRCGVHPVALLTYTI
jgi:hypothetical protein